MRVEKRYLLIFWFFLLYVENATKAANKSERRKRHFFPLLGYFQGYKLGHNFALQYPSYALQPIIIVPTVNQQQGINIQKSYADESYQESGGIFQSIHSSKLIFSNISEVNSFKKLRDTIRSQNIDMNFDKDVSRQSESIKNVSDVNNMQSTNKTNNDANAINATYMEIVTTNNVSEFIPLYIRPLTHTNENISSNLTLPDPDTNHIFYMPSNSSLSSIDKNVSADASDFIPNLDTGAKFNNDSNNSFLNLNSTDPIVSNNTENIMYPNSELLTITSTESDTYPNAWYNNDLVDKIRLTTNSYNEEYLSSSSYDDRWDMYPEASNIHSLSGFRPLAGLYYDGFLDKPVTKRKGFVPYKN